jgi:hypothetical protein
VVFSCLGGAGIGVRVPLVVGIAQEVELCIANEASCQRQLKNFSRLGVISKLLKYEQ